MKKLFKLSFIILIPIVAGVGCLVGGVLTGNGIVSDVGVLILSLGTFITMFTLVVVSLVLIMTGKLDLSNSSEVKTSNEEYRREEEARLQGSESNTASATQPTGEGVREREEIAGVNSSRGFDNRMKYGSYMARHTANNYKHSTTKSKVLGWLFFAFLMTDFLMIVVFAVIGIKVGAVVCFCIFGGTIILSLIITKIIEHRSMNVKIDPSKKQDVVVGEVKACLMSSSSSVGGSHRHSRTRITSIIYRIIVTVDGKDYTAFKDRFYETGERVAVIIIGKNSASIVDEEELRQATAEIKAQTAELRARLDSMQEKSVEIKAGTDSVQEDDEIAARVAERKAKAEERIAKRAAKNGKVVADDEGEA